MYLLEMADPTTLTETGMPADVSTPINLTAGFNWIGFTPQTSMDLSSVLGILGDDALFIQSQSQGSATNYGAYGWYGSLTTLEPGNGYLLEMSAPGTLIYPESTGMARTADNKKAVHLTDTVSDWDFHYGDYKYVGSITTSIDNRDDSAGDLVGVFVDGECRGIAERMYFPFNDSYMYIVQVYSNVEEEILTFKYYDSSNDKVIEYSETVEFTNYMNVGDGFNTFALSSEIRPGVYTLTDAYPNPFNPTTEFSYIIGESGQVSVSVYDINGRMVAELANEYRNAGSYRLEWNAGNVSSGVYLIKMIVNNHTAIQKIMLIK